MSARPTPMSMFVAAEAGAAAANIRARPRNAGASRFTAARTSGSPPRGCRARTAASSARSGSSRRGRTGCAPRSSRASCRARMASRRPRTRRGRLRRCCAPWPCPRSTARSAPTGAAHRRSRRDTRSPGAPAARTASPPPTRTRASARSPPEAPPRTRWPGGSAQTVLERTAREPPPSDERAEARVVLAGHVARVERAGRRAVLAVSLRLRRHREPVADGRVVAAVLEVRRARAEHGFLVRVAVADVLRRVAVLHREEAGDGGVVGHPRGVRGDGLRRPVLAVVGRPAVSGVPRVLVPPEVDAVPLLPQDRVPHRGLVDPVEDERDPFGGDPSGEPAAEGHPHALAHLFLQAP